MCGRDQKRKKKKIHSNNTDFISESNSDNMASFFNFFFEKTQVTRHIGPVWYIYLKTENCYLKIFVKIYMDKKVYKNM